MTSRSTKKDPKPQITIVLPKHLQGGPRHVAAFRLNKTLIQSRDGSSVFSDSWVWTFPSVPVKLKELNEQGWLVVTLSEQDVAVEELWEFCEFQFPVVTGAQLRPLWKVFLKESKVEPGPGSFFCGSRALAEYNPYIDPRWQTCHRDVDFAEEAGLAFYRPDQLFDPHPGPDPTENTEVVLILGQPGSGEKCWLRKISRVWNYVIASDLKHIQENLADGKSVVYLLKSGTWVEREAIINAIDAPFRIFWITRPGEPYEIARMEHGYDGERPNPPEELTRYTETFDDPEDDPDSEVVIIA
jgi:hypothetical protein